MWLLLSGWAPRMLRFLSGHRAWDRYFPERQLPEALSCSHVDPLPFPSLLVFSTSETLLQSRWRDRENVWEICMKKIFLCFVFITFLCNISVNTQVSLYQHTQEGVLALPINNAKMAGHPFRTCNLIPWVGEVSLLNTQTELWTMKASQDWSKKQKCHISTPTRKWRYAIVPNNLNIFKKWL